MEGDAAVTAVPGAILAVQSADCAPVVFSSDQLVAIAHAGWRGIVEGVIPSVLAAMRVRGATEIHALLGPCIAPGGYTFGTVELDEVAEIAGPRVRAVTIDGRPALDLPAAVATTCAANGVTRLDVVGPPGSSTPFDTSGPDWFSHRTRADRGRQVTVAWLERR
jgi:purine-nucleoside/S-methyl-5'-thioadenosine phosphorylase / adenosine deaminase